MKEDIEEDMKILEDWLKELNDLFNKTRINNTKERNALEHILSDYKRVLKENEELRHKYDKALSDLVNAEKENKTLTDAYMIQKHLINAEFLSDYISKQKNKGRDRIYK